MIETKASVSDFSQGPVYQNILRLAGPMTLAQLINVLYNIIDRMYIGHMAQDAVNALTGVGLTFPILSIVLAFANLFGTGGAPLFSMARGRGDTEDAGKILGNTFAMLLSTGVVLTAVILLCQKPLLYLFGASDITYPYASSYLTIYLCGSVFVMVGLGLNNFINAQGFGRTAMGTVVLGAILNIVLDPLFIFGLHLGVAGAAIATVISQFASAAWAVRFLTGAKAVVRLRRGDMRLQLARIRRIVTLGLSGFIVSITNSAVQIVCNATLQHYSGDLYVGVMTIINSTRDVVTAPVNGLTSASQPVLGYNYGAQQYRRVRTGIGLMSILCVAYTTVVWLILLLFPTAFIRIFTDDPALAAATVPSMHLYFFGFFMMSLQIAGQTAAVSLGRSAQSIFFSLFRKIIIVVPLTLLLPRLWGLGVRGVFLAEPVSNFIGGGACYITMLLTIWRGLRRKEREAAQPQPSPHTLNRSEANL